MDPETAKVLLIVFQLLVIAIGTMLWFHYRDLKSKVEGVAVDLAQYKTHIAETHVTQAELMRALETLSRSIQDIFKKLDRIEDKLDNKQDK